MQMKVFVLLHHLRQTYFLFRNRYNNLSIDRMNTYWRNGDCDLSLLIPRFRDSSAAASLADITFHLADGSTVRAHKFILAAASPYFEAKFCGPPAGDSNKIVDCPQQQRGRGGEGRGQ